MIIEKQQENTSLEFYFLDYNVNEQNLFPNLKIKNQSTIDLEIKSHSIKKVIICDMQKQLICVELYNKHKILKYEVEVIANQSNIFYVFINQEEDNIIDFRYKNYSKKNPSKKEIKIKFQNKNVNLNFHFIDNKNKIGRFILLNASIKFEIISDIAYLNNDISHNIWIYSLKEYENCIQLTCHPKNIDSTKINDKNKSRYDYNLKQYKKTIDSIKNKNENIILKYVNLGNELNNVKSYLKANENYNYLKSNIRKIKFLNINEFENFYVFLYIQNIIFCHEACNNKIIEIEGNVDKEIQLINNFFENLKMGLSNLEYSYTKLKESKKIPLEEKVKILSVIYSIIIDNPLGKNNIDTLKKINIEEIEKNNKNNCYVKANNIFKEIITNLNSDSLLTEAALELNSNYSKNYNEKIKEEYSIEICFITLEELRSHLIQLVPKYIYIINHESDNYSFYDRFSKEIVMNEKYIFKDKTQKEIERILEEEKNNDIYTLRILCLLFHEVYGHSKVRVNDPEKSSPIKFNYKGYLVAIINEKKEGLKESGKIIENYLTDFNKSIMEFFLNSDNNYDAKRLLEYKLYIGENLDDIKKIVYEIKDKYNYNNINVTDFNEYLKEYENKPEKMQILSQTILIENLHKYLTKFERKIDYRDFGIIKNFRNDISSSLFK